MPARRSVELPEWNKQADVVVVGYGGAGASAAITAHDAGAKVILIEKLPADVVDEHGNIVEVRHHPNSRMTGSSHLCTTDPEGAFAYQKQMNSLMGFSDVPDDMLWAWAQELYRNPEWLKSLGAGLDGGEGDIYYTSPNHTVATAAQKAQGYSFGTEFPEFPGSTSMYTIRPRQAGWGWFGLLSGQVKKRGIEVLYGTPAKELVQDPGTKEILGVIAEDSRGRSVAVRANRAVVLTTGGFEYNMEMQATYLRAWPFHFIGNTGNTGDGIKMAQKAGAALWHMNNVAARVGGWWPDFPVAFSFSLSGGRQWDIHRTREGKRFPHYEDAYSIIMVDKHGKRFANEQFKGHTFYWEVIHFDTEKTEFPRIPSHLIFDEKRRVASPMNIVAGASTYSRMYQWSPDLKAEIEKGWIRKADTIRELATKIDVPPAELEASVNRWNRACKEGEDKEFGRRPGTLQPLATPPYYEMILWPSGPNTQGGPKRNKDAQIVDPENKPIPRLYSAGEMGSIYGFLYDTGGNTAECMAFGRIAGRNAAAQKPWAGKGSKTARS